MSAGPDDAGAGRPEPRLVPRWAQPIPPASGLSGAGGHPRHAQPPAWQPGGCRPDDQVVLGVGADEPVIRPFMLTGGRTRPTQDGLRVETLIQTATAVEARSVRFEARRILELCRQPQSVAELSAALRLPLGVTRVLVGDLVADGCVVVVRREELSVQLLERIRDRVRAL